MLTSSYHCSKNYTIRVTKNTNIEGSLPGKYKWPKENQGYRQVLCFYLDGDYMNI